MTIIRQKWQPIWHQLTHFQTKNNATQNLYLQALNSSHRPIRKFIVVFIFSFSVPLYKTQLSTWWPSGLCTHRPGQKFQIFLFGISFVRTNPIRWKTVLEELQVIILNTNDIFFNKCSQTK